MHYRSEVKFTKIVWRYRILAGCHNKFIWTVRLEQLSTFMLVVELTATEELKNIRLISGQKTSVYKAELAVVSSIGQP